MTENQENPVDNGGQPSEPGTTRDTGISVWNAGEKELSFEETLVKFKLVKGKWRMSLRHLAREYSITFSNASQKLTHNPELFRDLELDSVTQSGSGGVSDYWLSVRDTVAFLYSLNYKRYDDERKDRHSEHSFLTGMVTHITRKVRKKNPHCGAATEQEIYKEDFSDMKGSIELEPGWRRKLDSKEGKKLAAKKLFQAHQLLSNNVEKNACRVAVIKDMEEFCPEYMPDYMPKTIQIETTKQVRLITEGASS